MKLYQRRTTTTTKTTTTTNNKKNTNAIDIENNNNDEQIILINKKNSLNEIRRRRRRRRYLNKFILGTIVLTAIILLTEILLYYSITPPRKHNSNGNNNNRLLYLRSVFLSPIKTFHARFLDSRPTKLKEFHLSAFIKERGSNIGSGSSSSSSSSNGFVINLKRDVERLESFIRYNTKNIKNKVPTIQRFPAHEWLLSSSLSSSSSSSLKNNNITNSDADTNVILRVQQYWEENYPWIKLSVQRKRYGDAACSLSHILLWKEQLLLLNSKNDYIFVFEDDVRFTKPFFDSNFTIYAPDTADMVLLSPRSASKLVNVPFYNNNNNNNNNRRMIMKSSKNKNSLLFETITAPTTTTTTTTTVAATRAIGGSGSYGYIITKQGYVFSKIYYAAIHKNGSLTIHIMYMYSATKVLKYLKTCHEPIDICFFQMYNLIIYLSIGDSSTTFVRHANGKSTRLNSNKQTITKK